MGQFEGDKAIPPKLAKMQVFGITLAMALAMQPAVQDLACVELWAGVQSISRAARAAGMKSEAMDINRIPGETDKRGLMCENILTKEGFNNALSAVLRPQPQGLLWMAPVCSSWVWMNSSNCQRSKRNPAGNTAYGPVKDGNKMALIAAFLYALAMLIGAKPVIEQPSGSMMFRFRALADVIQEFKAKSVTCVRCAFTPGVTYGQRFLKRYKFLGEAWVAGLHTKCQCPGGQHADMVKRGKNGSVTGNLEALKASQSYPDKLGEFVVSTLKKSQVPVQSSTVSSSWKRPLVQMKFRSAIAKRAKALCSSWKNPTV